jgi:hypothetical protein
MDSLVFNSTNQKVSFVDFGYTNDNSNLHTSYTDTSDFITNWQRNPGEIPFLSPGFFLIRKINYFNPKFLTIPTRQDGVDFNLLVADAVKRHKELNNALDYDTSLAVSFLFSLKSLSHKHNFRPYIIFTQFGAKAEFDFNNKHYVFDYDYEDPNSIVLLCNADGELNTKECSLDKLESVFEVF